MCKKKVKLLSTRENGFISLFHSNDGSLNLKRVSFFFIQEDNRINGNESVGPVDKNGDMYIQKIVGFNPP